MNIREKIRCFFCMVLSVAMFMSMVFGFDFAEKNAQAAVSVDSLKELKEALLSSKKTVIVVKKDISVRETLESKGNKIIKSGGGKIKRAIAKNSAFGGTLIRVTGGSLSLRGVKIDGGGSASQLKNKLYGRLIDVVSGQLSIRDGATLTSNKNSTRAADGGGAVRVRSGGTFVMYGGSITANTSVSSGAGVRVEKGGVFYMKGGSISRNRVVGKSNISDFDGSGGGVYNAGSMVLSDGTVYANSSSAYVKGTSTYGGVGGGICNKGACLINGTRVTSNKAAVYGGGVVTLGGKTKYANPTVISNNAKKGRDIAVLGGQNVCEGKLSIGEIWLGSGKALKAGSCSTGKKVRLIPGVFSDRRVILSHISGSYKKAFVLGGPSDLTKKYKLKKSGGKVILKKRKNKPKPTPTPTRAPGTSQYSRQPAPTVNPAKTPARTYIPVATLDPSSAIKTAAPQGLGVPMFFSSTSPSVSPFVSPLVSPTATTSPMPSVQTVSPQASANQSANPSPITTNYNQNKVIKKTIFTYYFSCEEIKKIKEINYVKTDKYSAYNSDCFMRIINKCLIRTEEKYE